jgi:hypothetical protein
MTLMRVSVGRFGIRVGSGIERALRGCRGVLSSQIDRRFLLRWTRLKVVVGARGGDPAALDWSNLQKCLLPDLFEDRGLRLEIPSQGSFGYYVLFAQPGGGGIYGRREITVTVDDALAYHDLLIADPRPRGVRVADRLMKSAVDLYMKMKLNRIELRAGLSGGGRIWPKYGFRPKSEADWQACKERIRSNLRQLDDSVQQQWGAVVESLLEANSPRTIWTVSEISYICQGHKLGDILLTGTIWRGILELEDPEAVRRLAARLNTV